MDVSLEEKVRLRAYELWLSDGSVHGRDWDHWYTAECELHIERAAAGMKAVKRKRKKDKQPAVRHRPAPAPDGI
jgi:hypothetical protein